MSLTYNLFSKLANIKKATFGVRKPQDSNVRLENAAVMLTSVLSNIKWIIL